MRFQMIDNSLVTAARLRSEALGTVGRVPKRANDDAASFTSPSVCYAVLNFLLGGRTW